MADLPTLDEVVERLKELAEVDEIDPSKPISELEIDSMDILEWTYVLEEETGYKIDESALDGLKPESTLAEVYGLLIAAASKA